MESMHINIKSKEVYEQVLQFLKSFDRAELQFIEEKQIKKTREELQKELKAIDDGSSDLMDLEDYDKELEERLARYENKNF